MADIKKRRGSRIKEIRNGSERRKKGIRRESRKDLQRKSEKRLHKEVRNEKELGGGGGGHVDPY
jgi:hypothetical protein